ncbi:MAG: TetR/AcrR family transcriptional regulator [Phenylobacterium sp.]|uniref:TetR/AcrR family transcriptional regulator n=1 Tax=Phenylobacterium sp. TaxID=1871053 RepID=UPI002735DEE7|nr:TetR/AcrR family transcriptional regulator [Phenylobacterium sp.]MDP3176081.1 TetR/AcrR family transcriptional regulator [Phenylobacterium sp.]
MDDADIRAGGSKPGARGRDRRLGRADWMAAGQALLIEGGVRALRLAALTARLKVSSGSFYHHFRDMDEFLGALADDYSAEQIERLIDEISRETQDPLDRLRLLARRTWRSELMRLDGAMRVWAASDPRAAQALKRSEGVVLAFMSEAFRVAGFDDAAATMRARLFTSLQVAHLLSLSDAESWQMRREVFVLLTALPAKR